MLVARCWIAPLETLLWEMVGLDRSSSWHILRTGVAWIKDLGRLVYTGLGVNVSRWDGSEWSVIYVSDDPTNDKMELQHLLFPRSPTETKLGRVFLWQLPALIQRFVSQECLVICDVNRLVKWRFQRIHCIRVLPWLRSYLDVSSPVESIIKRMTKHRRRNVSKVKKQDFEYGVSHDPADLDLFYHKMYIPYINKRYDDRAIIHLYEEQREVFEKRGQLLCVKYQGALIAACLGTLRRYDKTFSALLLGVDQEHVHAVKQDVIMALYWHVISWAHANHLHIVDFGRTRARLTDGVFEFKRRWGMQFKRDITTYTMWTLIGKNLPLALIRHLNELALIAEVDKEYRCVVFSCGETSLSDKELAQREKSAAHAGLDGLLEVGPKSRPTIYALAT
jgi:hypothetical protein